MTAIPLKRARRADSPDSRMTVREHLRELRNRLAKALLGVGVGSALGWWVHGRLIAKLTGPVCAIHGLHGIGRPTPACPNGLLVLQGVLSPLTFTFKVALLAGLITSSPVWSYQLWAFAAPGLHRREKRYGLAFVSAAVPLFLGGAALAYWVFPKALQIVLGFTPNSFSNSIPGDQFLDFFLRMIAVFGLSFELPLLLVLLYVLGVVSARSLLGKWRAFVFGIFVFAALATPTGDPFTMMVLALPMTTLLALALAVVHRLDRVRTRRAAERPEPSPDTASDLDLTPTPVEPPTQLVD
ncbi:MAG TPA: twin-arginine translocase subunit TatC [Actinocrinis sp.]|uniref:twin-arginine translocase subunit TatC n=1 Tax=Actinocrinis sp. TaxID=1920516 RepID=UPI002DDCE6AC|nr:twin-arginine translocase subunit TatC [Actinocrinis sp.]HEV2343063.1 twin-arginine translocase subunit TatC [Actinocrinis sp.]